MAGKKLTEEQKKIVNEKRRQTKFLRYGDPNYNNQEKHKQTCLERYGVEHHNQTIEARQHIREKKLTKEVQEKYENTLMKKYGANNVNKIPAIRKKMENSLLQHYGVTNQLKNKEIKDKQVNTMKMNKTFNYSKQEKSYYEYLISKYGKDDVLYQYKDKERYPFYCDFYIKSKDLFIEINLHWTHGGKPYNPDDKECQEKLQTWQERAKTSQFYANAIYVWTQLDVKKKNYAKQNNLNYITIYKL